MNTLKKRAISRLLPALILASLATGCVHPLLTTDAKLEPGDKTARLRVRLATKGSISVLQYAPSKCYAFSDPAVRSLATIYKGEKEFGISLTRPEKLGMPSDLNGVPQYSYEEIVVKAGTPLDFGVHWSYGNQYFVYRANAVAEFVPEAGKDYELKVAGEPKAPLQLAIDELQLNDGHITRVPVTIAKVHLCGT
ncbi:hypothetical protein EN871_27795 [bacterium M00.F.Ca.ET.228.01.1.1]|nr:hypothetical protein EN871_27795 [bacterium M00.F.Ca.ET.228.01.1.1]TGR96689.1 hypothetical protein EN834_27195 [bacterium M00.F.Ca.ET.191.01.1.1]TGT97956.1 hypothetical protein EN798_27200 [bacterium M00.F.Ca.ET.155.01.1.1]